jgi:hypothetical protein
VTVADDFIVDVFRNGERVPDASRHLVAEIFGATVETMDVAVHSGDWLVFNVVQNRLRWGGARYFGAAGLFAKDEFGFVSDASTGDWSCCEDPAQVARFVSERDYLADRACVLAEPEWDQGRSRMKEFAGATWDGDGLWGFSSNTWIKLRVR